MPKENFGKTSNLAPLPRRRNQLLLTRSRTVPSVEPRARHSRNSARTQTESIDVQVSQAKFSQDYVTDVIRQSDVAEPDSRRPPWRIHLIPLAFDPLAEEDCSTCCLVAQCHELLTSVVDNLIQRALKIHRMDFGSSLPTSHHYRVLTVSVERSIPSGSHAPAVSWTKAIPRTDFIDRVCSLAGTTIRELFIVSFSQSLNQCYNQSGMLRSDSVVKLIKGREESSIYFVWKA